MHRATATDAGSGLSPVKMASEYPHFALSKGDYRKSKVLNLKIFGWHRPDQEWRLLGTHQWIYDAKKGDWEGGKFTNKESSFRLKAFNP